MVVAADPWFVALGLWGVGVVKALGMLLAPAPVQLWGRALCRHGLGNQPSLDGE